MKYVVEMGSDAMIYAPSFIKIDSGIQKFILGDMQTYRQHGDHIGLLLFFQNKESRLKWWKGVLRKSICIFQMYSLKIRTPLLFPCSLTEDTHQFNFYSLIHLTF
jgi:hypothetical protein